MAKTNKIFKFLTHSLAAGAIALIASCSSGFEYDPNTATLTIIPGQVQFGDLQPDETANQLEQQARALDTEGKRKKAFKIYKQIAEDYPYSRHAPYSRFRMADYYDQRGKLTKAFDNYESLISTYMGTNLYQKSLERQAEIAHSAALGHHKKKILVFKTRLASSTVDAMLAKTIKNAPHSPLSPKSQYLRGFVLEEDKRNERAIEQYRTVTRDYSESNFSGEALFRIGSILYQQSQNGNTNLDNSKLALQTFEELSTLYPKHAKTAEAKQLAAQIRGYDNKRSFEIAEFYVKKGQFTSARFYYKDIISSTPKGSEPHKRALAKLAAIDAATSGN